MRQAISKNGNGLLIALDDRKRHQRKDTHVLTPRPLDLKAVAVTEVSYSLEETIETSGMELKPGIAGQLAEATQGHLF